jgi:mannitol/fructose-specific phosphotransferase system IIA component (Ntr-type)
MSRAVKHSKAVKHKDFLSLLSKSKNNKKRRNQLLSIASPSELLAIAEICHNLLKGNLALKKPQQKKLEKYKKVLRKLSQKSIGKDSRKRLLQRQQGGFFGALLPVAISALSSIIPSLLTRRK